MLIGGGMGGAMGPIGWNIGGPKPGGGGLMPGGGGRAMFMTAGEVLGSRLK